MPSIFELVALAIILSLQMDMSTGFVSDPDVCPANAAIAGPAPGKDGVMAMAQLAGSCNMINGRGGGIQSLLVQYWKAYCCNLDRERNTAMIVLGLDNDNGEVCLAANPGGSHIKKSATINLDDGGRQSGLLLDTPSYLMLALLSPWVPFPDTVMRLVLEVVNLGSDNVHVDLGCGDGRFNFT
jgi:hypothetical protein